MHLRTACTSQALRGVPFTAEYTPTTTVDATTSSFELEILTTATDIAYKPFVVMNSEGVHSVVNYGRLD